MTDTNQDLLSSNSPLKKLTDHKVNVVTPYNKSHNLIPSTMVREEIALILQPSLFMKVEEWYSDILSYNIHESQNFESYESESITFIHKIESHDILSGLIPDQENTTMT